MCASSARCRAPGILVEDMGASSKRAFRDDLGVSEVRLSTIELIDWGFDCFLSAAPGVRLRGGSAKLSKKGLVSRGESGEKEGKDVSDLSDAATEEAELEGCDVSLALWRDLVRRV